MRWLIPALLVSLLHTGCKSGGGSVPRFSLDTEFLAVGDPPTDGSPVASFQDALDGWNYVFDTSSGEPEYICQHDDAETAQKMKERGFIDEIACAEPQNGGASDGPSNLLQLPPGWSDWRGAEQGGCGVVAIATCNRRLGITPADQPLSAEEWNVIADQAGMSEHGTINIPPMLRYYRAYRLCVDAKVFPGRAEDYAELARLQERGCDLKLAFARRLEGGRYAGAHIETIVAVGDGEVTTNSWGLEGIVRGGSAGGFSHSRDNQFQPDPDVSVKWPADSTEVVVSAVCQCTEFEQLGQKILSH